MSSLLAHCGSRGLAVCPQVLLTPDSSDPPNNYFFTLKIVALLPGRQHRSGGWQCSCVWRGHFGKKVHINLWLQWSGGDINRADDQHWKRWPKCWSGSLSGKCPRLSFRTFFWLEHECVNSKFRRGWSLKHLTPPWQTRGWWSLLTWGQRYLWAPIFINEQPETK